VLFCPTATFDFYKKEHRMNELLNVGAQALRRAALNQEAKAYLLGNAHLFNVLKKAADRYIGGESLQETVTKVMAQNQEGFKCSIEFMGENVATEQEAAEATAEFAAICRIIMDKNLNSTVSLDLSHIGLGISADLCLNNLRTITNAAAAGNIEVIISAEGTDQTDAVMDTYKKANGFYNNLGITLQAYLYRTQDDFNELIGLDGRIRIVKGAFETKKGLSMSRGTELDDAYLSYVERLLRNRHKCSIATHHAEIQSAAKMLVDQHKPEKDFYEFESLFGIQDQQLKNLKNEGYHAKVYFVYGTEWYLYLCNRIAEYPLNIFRALDDITK
jgi:proline dehydrogenase